VDSGEECDGLVFGVIDVGEECDGVVFGVVDECVDFVEFAGGVLSCTGDCRLDTSGCVVEEPVSFCGDGVADVDEQCDGFDLHGLSSLCSDFSSSFVSGVLSCTGGCVLSTSGCVERVACGNGFLDVGESCDGVVFAGGSSLCSDFDSGFSSGVLSCTGLCEVDTSGCGGAPVGFCGDGVINGGELCDSFTFGLVDECVDFTQYEGGVLRCDASCEFDTSDCILVSGCGDGFLDAGELCDGVTFGFVDECVDFTDFIGGDLDCTSTCLLDTSGCIDVPSCGNGVIDANEDCDGLVFGVIDSCVDYPEFVSGSLVCTLSTCQLDTSLCRERANCGNGVVDVGEQCDGVNFGGISTSCAAFSSSFVSGSLVCDGNCILSTAGVLSTSGCVERVACGNGFLDVGESCDGVVFAGGSSLCSDFSSSFVSGVLSCTGGCY